MTLERSPFRIGLAAALGAWLAAGAAGCGSDTPPVLEARTSLDYVFLDLYAEADGFSWWDNDVKSAGDQRGKITFIDNRMVANGGFCGVYRWGPCDATLTDGRIEIHLPDRNGTAGNIPQLTFGLERVSGVVQIDDGVGGVLLSLQSTADGSVAIADRNGVLVATTERTASGISVVGVHSGAYLGAVDSDLPPEIAALALGDGIDTSGDPDIPDHAIVVAAAMTWLR